MPTREIEAVIATSQPLKAYGGVQIDDSVLEDIAERLQSGRVPMLIQHDVRRQLDSRILEARVEERADGYKDVRIRFEVDSGQWEKFARELKEIGAPGGFSFACSESLAVVDGPQDAPLVGVDLSADASHWTDEELLAAAEDLRVVATVNVGRRYEFAHEPAAVVVLQFVLAPVLLAVVANAVYDGLRHFLRVRRPTVFHFRVERDDGLVEAHLETDDAEALRRAIDAFGELASPGRRFEWDAVSERWRPL